MPGRIDWTPEMDTTITTMRAAGASWAAISAALGITRWPVIERGNKIGALSPAPPAHCEPEPDRSPDPLPPGDPDTWDIIIKGTLLEGTRYPVPGVR